MDIVKQLVKQEESSFVKELEVFSKRLKHESLFYAKSSVIEDLIKKYENMLSKIFPSGTSFFRVRRHSGKRPPDAYFSESEIRNPPKDKALEGRLNPSGISFLYMANDLHTAILETQCHAGDFVTCAKFEAVDEKKYFNLSIVWNSDIKVSLSEEEKLFFDRLDFMISEPLSIHDDPTCYRVTQWFGDYVKSLGFDCLVYSSCKRIINAVNICGFNPEDWRLVSDSIRGVFIEQEGIPTLENWDL